ncbi:MAG: hypothetical protein KatS3mg027_1224 [Bacteroidia bacterium]|nr:MAG: hypothetical protein KatS3mg027_1224 [Bacteroidia bacterium]
MYFNPASTGFFNGFYKGTILHRQQWTGIGKGFVTTFASFDAPIYDVRKKRNKAGLGGFFYMDKAGDSKFKTTQVSASASGMVQLSKKHFLSGGIQLSYVQKSFDLSDIQWVNQYNGKRFDANINPNESFSMPMTNFLDVGIGGRYEFQSAEITYDTKSFQKFSLDFALFHATEPMLQYVPSTEEAMKNRWVVSAHYLNDFENNSLGINVYALYMKQSVFEQWMGMFLLRMRMKSESHITGLLNSPVLSAGLIFRNTGFLIPNVRFKFSHFEIGLCYDAFVSVYHLMPKGMNAFEIQITYSKLRNSLRNIK